MGDGNDNGGGSAIELPGSRALADAVKGELSDAQKKQIGEQLMRQAQLKAANMQRRENLAAIILNGMCAGVYNEILAGDTPKGFGDRLLDDAFQFADGIIARSNRDAGLPVPGEPPGQSAANA